MAKAPVGAIVSIYYDADVDLHISDALKTRSGRVYVIVELRRQVRGIHAGRWHIKALVSESVPEGTRMVYPILWYPRGRKKR